MKRKLLIIVSILSVICMMLCTVTADSSSTKIQSVFAKNGNATAREWYTNKDSRAILTVALAADVFSQMKDFESDDLTSFILNPSYVGISVNSRQLLLIGYYGSTTILIIIYTPSTNEIEYSTIKMNGVTLDDVMMEGVLQSTMESVANGAAFEKNDKNAILTQCQSLFD